jgi:hypothetical protein
MNYTRNNAWPNVPQASVQSIEEFDRTLDRSPNDRRC